MDFEAFDSSGTDDDLPPQSKIPRGGRLAGNGRAAVVASVPYPRMYSGADMETEIHRLEREAYSSVLRAFTAQADAITWEKEDLITELRKELRVSNEEHRELLGRVTSEDVIRRIRDWRHAGGIQSGIATPRTAKEKNFAAYQEGCRKDVERAFGQFQARWHIIRQPANYWDKDDLHSIMLCCVIMHNMICEDERGLEKCDYYIVKSDRKKKQDRDNARRREFEAGEPGGSSDEDELDELDEVGVQKKEDFKEDKWRYAEKKAFYAQMQSHELHERMKVDLIEHCWKHRGASRTERGVATTTI